MSGGAAGGANKKMKKFPKIADYLQVKHPKVWEIFNDAGMLGSLSPRKGAGVTLLLPDKKTLEKYEKVLEGDKPEEVTDWLSSLVLTDCVTTLKGFETVTNLLGKKLPMEKGALKGAKLEQDKVFKPFERSGQAKRSNMAVWNIAGEYPWNEGASGGRRFARVRGGEEPVSGRAEAAEISNFVNKVFRAEREQLGKSSNPGGRSSPCMVAVRNILEEWSKNNEELYHRAQSILTVDPVINFCLIYLNAHVFSCDELQIVGFNLNADGTNGKARYLELLSKPSECCVVLRAGKRGPLIDSKPDNAYESIDKTNSVGNLSGVYPEKLAEIFKSHPGLHRMIDEFKFIMAHHMNAINSTVGTADALSKWDEMVKIVVGMHAMKRISCFSASLSDVTNVFKDSRYNLHMPRQDEDVNKINEYYGAAEDDEDDTKGKDDESAPQSGKCAISDDLRKELGELLDNCGGNIDKIKEALGISKE